MRIHKRSYTMSYSGVTTEITPPYHCLKRSIMTGRRIGLAFALSCTAMLCLPTGGFSSARRDLPTTIRLVRHGVIGDRYAMQSTSHTVITLRFEKSDMVDETSTDSTETRPETRVVRTIAADGALTIEERTGEFKRTVIKDGERDVPTVPADGRMVTYKPDGTLVRRAPLPKPDADDNVDTNNNEPPPLPRPDPDAKLTSEPPFPDKALHVGDTWTGTVHMLPFEFSSDPNVNFTGKLVAIEMHQSVPCARVEYTFTATSTRLPNMISKLLSEEAKGKGTIKVTGTTTEYYSLDRGAVLSSEGKNAITMQFDLTEPNPNGDEDLHRVVKATIKTSGNSTTTKSPAYNAALLPAPTAGQ